MAEGKLETEYITDRRLFLYEFPLRGFSLKFVSGPEMTKNIKPGEWLDRWEMTEGKRRFAFGPRKNVAFVTKEAAIDAQTELRTFVDVVTEIAE
jgi:hypothetical protein